jgi:hypothetical protein
MIPTDSLSPFTPVMQTDFPELEREVTLSLHSRKQYDHARVIYQNPELFDPIKRASALSGYLPTVPTAARSLVNSGMTGKEPTAKN